MQRGWHWEHPNSGKTWGAVMRPASQKGTQRGLVAQTVHSRAQGMALPTYPLSVTVCPGPCPLHLHSGVDTSTCPVGPVTAITQGQWILLLTKEGD